MISYTLETKVGENKTTINDENIDKQKTSEVKTRWELKKKKDNKNDYIYTRCKNEEKAQRSLGYMHTE